MAEHEKGWAGPDNVPITVGTVKVEDPKEMQAHGKKVEQIDAITYMTKYLPQEARVNFPSLRSRPG